MIKYYLTPKAIKAGCKFERPKEKDAGYDIMASKDAVLYPGNTRWIQTGLSVAIPSSGLYPRVGLIRDRSSMAAKGLFTHAGVIDPSFRGTIKVLISYTPYEADGSYLIEAGDRIAQMIIVQYLSWPTERVGSVDDLGQTKRSDKGFGSTGT